MEPKVKRPGPEPGRTVFVFDLDGTLIDSVYQHIQAWRESFAAEGLEIPVWRIHRKIGMSGGLLAKQILREAGTDANAERIERLNRSHGEAYGRLAEQTDALPGARALLAQLGETDVPYAIATSSDRESARSTLESLHVPSGVPLITRDEASHSKPDPQIFLAAIEQLDAGAEQSVIVGDSVWDMLAARRAGALGVGLRCGGFGSGELERAGAWRVYEDPADLLRHLDEFDVRGSES